MGDKIKVIMDCDPGIDDGIALAYAAAHQDELELACSDDICRKRYQ